MHLIASTQLLTTKISSIEMCSSISWDTASIHTWNRVESNWFSKLRKKIQANSSQPLLKPIYFISLLRMPNRNDPSAWQRIIYWRRVFDISWMIYHFNGTLRAYDCELFWMTPIHFCKYDKKRDTKERCFTEHLRAIHRRFLLHNLK